MAVQNRSTKFAGGTNFETGKGTILSSEVDADFNTLYTLQDGNIDSANLAANSVTSSELASGAVSTNAKVASGADIAASKIDDISGDAAAHRDSSDPGTFSSQTLAATLTEEIKQQRYAIQRSAVGTSADTGAAAGTVGWYDPPARGRNLIRNGTFATDDDTAAANAAPPGWALVGTPTVALSTDAASGDGNVIQITGAGAANEGISQTLSGLKASTRYLVGCLAEVDSGDTFSLKTSGADTTEVDLDVTATSMTMVSGVFIQLVAAADTDVARVRDVFCFECSDDPVVPSASYVFRLSDSGVDTNRIAGTTWTTIRDDVGGTPVDMSISVNPVQGCQIRASAKVVLNPDDLNTHGLRLLEDGSAVDVSYLFAAQFSDAITLYCQYTNTAPAPGTALTYTIEAAADAGTPDVGFAGIGAEAAVSWLEVEVIFP
jgi:hypothetical protein